MNAATIRVSEGTITNANFSVAVPKAEITFTPLALTTVTSFDSATNTWLTTTPANGLSGNVFLAGAALPAPAGLPGGIKAVTWTANFTSDTPGLTVTWKWAAAVYTHFNTDMNALGVKPVDSLLGSKYINLHNAGTPENYRSYVTGGARGNGGSNYTGSYSANKNVNPDLPPPPTGISLSGSVYIDADSNGIHDDGEAGIADVILNLSGTDAQGNSVTRTVHTDADGHYTFANLPAGTYQVFEEQPNYQDGWETIGTVGGETRGELLENDMIGNIALGNGDVGIGYDFGEVTSRPR
jgi:SdrD B-like domain